MILTKYTAKPASCAGFFCGLSYFLNKIIGLFFYFFCDVTEELDK
ncbi:hypothetical protein C1A50_3644 [Paenibacillus polymyxa]|nr:hypothetical protein C1A50_3644 [Paenibacillus polymyxa]